MAKKKKTDRTRNKHWTEGFNAFGKKDYTQCPYLVTSPQGCDWNAGWETAKKERG